MSATRWSRILVRMAVLAVLVTMALPAVWAHPGRHRHRHPHRTAVIVVGDPRPVRHTVIIDGRPHGTLDINVKPKATQVWIDGRIRGTADRFDGSPQKLHLLPGKHHLKLVTPHGEVVHRDIFVRAGVEIDINLDFRD